MQGGQPLAINQQTLNARLQGKYLDWTVVRTSAQATAGQNMACFVPSGQHGQVQTSRGSLGIKSNSAKPFTIEDCKKVYAVPKVVDIMHSFQKGLDALHEKHNMVKLNCEYYDLDEMAIQLEYEKPNGGAPYHYNVWIQGEKADEASQKLGKNLQCRGSNYSETFSQVSAMINAII